MVGSRPARTGQPQPPEPDSDSRLARLEQDGWQVNYLAYAEHNGFTLPERIRLEGHDLQITLVVKDWQPRQLGR